MGIVLEGTGFGVAKDSFMVQITVPGISAKYIS